MACSGDSRFAGERPYAERPHGGRGKHPHNQGRPVKGKGRVECVPEEVRAPWGDLVTSPYPTRATMLPRERSVGSATYSSALTGPSTPASPPRSIGGWRCTGAGVPHDTLAADCRFDWSTLLHTETGRQRVAARS